MRMSMSRQETAQKTVKARGVRSLIVLVALVSSFFASTPLSAQRGGPRPPTPVIVFEAQLVPYSDRIEALGTLRANETVQLTAPVADTITAIHFDDGQRLEAGHVLVEMTNTEEQALLAEARSTVAESRAQFERARDLAERGSATRSTLDQRRRDYDTARARLRATESRLQDRLIIAPFDGVVGLRTVSVGTYVSPGQVITTLYNDGIMKLDFSIPEVHLAAIHVGQTIQAEAQAFPDQIFEGTVASIDAAIDPVTRSIQVRALIANEDRLLRPGLLMTLALERNAREAIVVPEGAIIVEARDRFVWVADAEGTNAEKRPVTLGTRRIGEVEILIGLEAGERVVTHGAANLRPGATITIRATETGGETLPELLNQE